MSPAAEVRGIIHHYGVGSRPRRAGLAPPALYGVDLTVEGSAVTALIGANGSGKTTLLRILAGILQPTAGVVRVLGIATAAGWPSREQRERVGYLSQDPALDPEMTAGETLDLLAALHGVRRGQRARRVGEIAEAFGLEQLERRVEALSGGQRRRLHLAAGMIHDPELLCLDEPAAGLDPDGSAALWTELERRATDGRASVIISHDLPAVEEHADAVAILDRGAIVAAGAPRAVVTQAAAQAGASDKPSTLAEVYRQLTGRSPAALEPKPRKRRGGGRRRR